ncbi:ROK family transcriptional regulator, partial [Rhizobium ruizarguesonis]
VRAGQHFAYAARPAMHAGIGNTANEKAGLNTVVGFESLRSRIGEQEFTRLLKGEEFSSPSLSQWIREAAGHLLDPIIAMAGFLAPSVVMIGS